MEGLQMTREELKARLLWAIDQVCNQKTPAYDEDLPSCVYDNGQGSHCIAGWFYKDCDFWDILRYFVGDLDDFNREHGFLDTDSLEYSVLCDMQSSHDIVIDPQVNSEEDLREELMAVFYCHFPEEEVIASNT